METILVLLPILFFGSIISTVAGGGMGIVLIVAFSFFFPIQDSIVLGTIMGFTIGFSKIFHFYKHINWHVAGWFLVLAIPGSYLGGHLLFVLPETLLRQGIAVLCLLFVIIKWFKKMPHLTPTIPVLISTGGAYGLISGTIGVGMPMRTALMLSFGLQREAFIGTSSLSGVGVNIGRTTAYLQNFVWTKEIVWLLILGTPVVLIAVWIGKKILRFVSKELFEKLLLCVILLAAIKIFVS